MALSKKIGNRLGALRRAAGLSKREVAERAKLSRSRVAKLERGRKADPRASTILALAGALGVPPGRLMEYLAAPKDTNGKGSKKQRKGKKAKRELLAAVMAGVGNGNDSAHVHSEQSSRGPKG